MGFWVLGVGLKWDGSIKAVFIFISFLFRLLHYHRCMASLMICLPTQHTSHPWPRAACVCVCLSLKSTDVVHSFRLLSFQRQCHTLLLPTRICCIVPELPEWVLNSQQCWFPRLNRGRAYEGEAHEHQVRPGHFTPKSKEINYIYLIFSWQLSTFLLHDYVLFKC